MATVQDITNILLGRGFQDELFSGLSGSRRKEKGGRETLCDCPFCEDTKGHFSYSSREPVWKCWKCDKHGDWIEYLKEARGLAFWGAVVYLAERAGVEVDGSAADKAGYEAYTRKASVLDAAHKLFIETFNRDDGDKVLTYLYDRGYSAADIEAMELGAYVDRSRLQEQLQAQGYTERDVKDSGLMTTGFGETHQLTTLWRDAAGRAIGLACRSILPADELDARHLQKYKYSFGLSKDSGLIGFSSVRGSEQLILVEGLLDALLLNSRGFKAVATGGTSLSAGQLQAMEATGTRELLLAMDTDEPGHKATGRIIESLSTSRLRLYVVDTGKFKDADELVREEGSEAFKECLDKAVRAASWYASMLVRQQDITTAIGMDRAVHKVLRYTAGLQDGLNKKEAEDRLRQLTGLTDEELATRRQAAEADAISEKAKSSLKATVRQLLQKSDEGDTGSAEQLMESYLQGRQQSRGLKAPEPYLVAGLLQDLAATPEGLETGYSIDDTARMPPGAITIVAGRPGHGKTAFMANCLLYQVEKYPEKAFYFFSYEEARHRLAVRLLMILAGDITGMAETAKRDYIHYLKAGRGYEKRPAIEQALQKFEEYTSAGRLVLVDSVPPAEDLAGIIGQVCRSRDVGGIYVDYIQRIPLRSPQQQRYLDIKQVSSLLLEQAKLANVPVILGAQLGRPEKKASDKWQSILSLDNLREAGDIEQDASLVLGLWNDVAGAKLEEQGAIDEYHRVAELKVVCLKHRDGRVDWQRDLSFDMATQRITESRRVPESW